ncbi:MAG: hypothetical protein F6K25_15185 [Okeania sp. SIO2G4]|uniref:hypothetical protein n=1 Tax=unclassified Okeania TaxID=2634635 RepID=UPI0013BB5004|nr:MULTISPECIES: hypothetical protein [unclassified Okeania]NEP07585.1 hypothetical protein [Okeania sp. SIO4D6]NEP42321.1 hypothetical protein [Okeania sp. SIO2H7]NEP74089.1 hypothetical protein [Okeania sp. SIO2G5]NEP95297.1 hypothetical protein [Okeania sp. SIO2F5]NEQ91965.1 hypothetical protein [Okeania sp. SIO2G4]
MFREELPRNYGIDRNIWTGQIISTVLESRWEVKLKITRIYEILKELNKSNPKAHRDDANTHKEEQKTLISNLKKNSLLKKKKKKIVFFDEFAVDERPSIFYGWAEKNTGSKVLSNQKGKRKKLNGMIAVDTLTGQEYFQLKEKSLIGGCFRLFLTTLSGLCQKWI